MLEKNLSSDIASAITPSPFVIFLDIDGVLYNTPNQDGVFKKVRELFPDYTERYDNHVCSIAAAYFFNKEALNNLNYLVKEIEKKRPVWIVISSAWREDRTIQELKETFFGIHEFSKYIVDKTPEELPVEEIKLYCPSKKHDDEYTYQCRASEITYWLKQHPEIDSYVVIDDYDNHLGSTFGERYFKTEFYNLLTKEICQKILSEHN